MRRGRGVPKAQARQIAERALGEGEELIWADGCGRYPGMPGPLPYLLGLLTLFALGTFWLSSAGRSWADLPSLVAGDSVGTAFAVFALLTILLGVTGEYVSVRQSKPPLPLDVLESRVYAVTSERLLVIDRDGARAFTRDEVGTPWVRKRSRGAPDVLFDRESAERVQALFRQTQQGLAGGVSAALSFARGAAGKGDGFILVDDADGLRDLIERWMGEGE